MMMMMIIKMKLQVTWVIPYCKYCMLIQLKQIKRLMMSFVICKGVKSKVDTIAVINLMQDCNHCWRCWLIIYKRRHNKLHNNHPSRSNNSLSTSCQLRNNKSKKKVQSLPCLQTYNLFFSKWITIETVLPRMVIVQWIILIDVHVLR